MIANTPGNFPTERVDRRTVLPAKVVTFIEQKEIEDMPGVLVEDRADVAVRPSKNNNKGEGLLKRCERREVRSEKLLILSLIERS